MMNAEKKNHPDTKKHLIKAKEHLQAGEWQEALSDGSANAFRETAEEGAITDKEISDQQLDKLLAENNPKNRPGASQAY
ncbi:hypothetical protein [Filimonas effusa]|uniref:Uncharacterized protein n=1 Tax=Filimonas effusa TaxID=2508721 RepID=A0A4Q1D561_9BACT|nr:hypothetical protein [Filimonas effusa]RXK83096.1 hypothetical protein ESB13_13305 [Filimonas effusa]